MSSGLSVEAMPCMIGLTRLPALNSVSCLTRYSGCWPCRIGLAGLPREPSAEWQAAQTFVEIAWPFSAAGLALTASFADAGARNAAANNRLDSREATGIMACGCEVAGCVLWVQNPAILQCKFLVPSMTDENNSGAPAAD